MRSAKGIIVAVVFIYSTSKIKLFSSKKTPAFLWDQMIKLGRQIFECLETFKGFWYTCGFSYERLREQLAWHKRTLGYLKEEYV